MKEHEPPRESAQQRFRDYLRTAFELASEVIAGDDGELEPFREPAEHAERLDLALGPRGRPLAEVVANLRALLAATVSSAHRRFFNQLYGGREPVSTLGELVAAAADVQMHTYKVAGPHALVEREVLGRMAQKVGYPDGEGTFTAGSSLANLMGLILARNQALPGVRDDGLAGAGPLAVYTSSESHYSISKNMGLIGLGRRHLRRVPADSVGRMDVAALAARIAADVAAGVTPVMINATAGTTVQGAFDPLVEIAAVAREHGVWLHVDGAYGGTVLLCESQRHLAAGSELCDSFAWNAHKMMGVPVVCSAILVRRRGLLARHFHEPASYLFRADSTGDDTDSRDLDSWDPGTRSLQCGRRHDALKLWCAWQHYGDEGYDARVRRQFALARHALRQVEADPRLVLRGQPQSINVCFEVAGKSSAEICDLLARQGRAMVGTGVVGGRRAIRLVCVNPDHDEADLDTFFREVKAVADQLGAG